MSLPDALIISSIVFNAGGFFWVVKAYKRQINGHLLNLDEAAKQSAGERKQILEKVRTVEKEAVKELGKVSERVAKIEQRCSDFICVAKGRE